MKKFFEKAKADFKFRNAGEGQTLGDERTHTQPQGSSSQGQAAQPRRPPSAGAQRAGQAALERFSQQEKIKDKRPQSTQATWKHSLGTAQTSSGAAASMASGAATALDYEKMKREVKQEMMTSQESHRQNSRVSSNAVTQPSTNEPLEVEAAPALDAVGIYLICPLCQISAKRDEVEAHMSQCLEIQYSTDPSSASATMIQTLNKDADRVSACVDILCKYLDNICLHPGEEKYRKIKKSNRVFQEKVSPITGGAEFLAACGFEEKKVAQEDKQETFYILPSSEEEDVSRLQKMKEVLTNTGAIHPSLDRNRKIYKATSRASNFELSPDFFYLSSEEVKREYRIKLEEVERNSQLRTKAMREADKRPSKKYRYTLIRVRFPDGVLLQGTFHSRDKLCDVMDFVRGCLISDWQPFFLSEACGQLTNEDAALSELGLVPGAILNFAWDSSVMMDIAAATGCVEQKEYLKPELLSQIQILE